MINFDFERFCYSCGLCGYICPVKAIHYSENLLPIVDANKCIDCHKCEKECLHLKNEKYAIGEKENFAKGYVCKNLNFEERNQSSSGGVFILLARQVLQEGGYVCGCIYDERFMPKHIITDDIKMVRKMMGSKYVKSDLGKCIEGIDECLAKKKRLLFAGTPCQVGMVKNVFGNNEYLILVSVVCHGSISRDMWKNFLKSEEHKKIIDVTMRDKAKGWANYGLKILYEDGSTHVTYRYDDGYFLKCFTDGYLDRDRCLTCSFKGDRIYADILLGDGWGMDAIFPEMTDKYGVSSVIILTDKGERLFGKLDSMIIEKKAINVNMIIHSNPRIVSPPQEEKERNKFYKEYKAHPENISNICKKYILRRKTLFQRVKRKFFNAKRRGMS